MARASEFSCSCPHRSNDTVKAVSVLPNGPENGSPNPKFGLPFVLSCPSNAGAWSLSVMRLGRASKSPGDFNHTVSVVKRNRASSFSHLLVIMSRHGRVDLNKLIGLSRSGACIKSGRRRFIGRDVTTDYLAVEFAGKCAHTSWRHAWEPRHMHLSCVSLRIPKLTDTYLSSK